MRRCIRTCWRSSTKTALGPTQASETVGGRRQNARRICADVAANRGSARQTRRRQAAHRGRKVGRLLKTVSVSIYDDFPTAAVFEVSYKNVRIVNGRDLPRWTNNDYDVAGAALWAFQPGTYEKRPAWVAPLKVGFHQKNYLGMNASDYGGGTPFADIWSQDSRHCGGRSGTDGQRSIIAGRHAGCEASELWHRVREVAKDRTWRDVATFRTFAIVHHGDFSTRACLPIRR